MQEDASFAFEQDKQILWQLLHVFGNKVVAAAKAFPIAQVKHYVLSLA